MFVVFCGIDIRVFGVLLRSKTVKALIRLFDTRVLDNCHPLLDRFFLVGILSEGECLTFERLLKFGWLRIKSVVVGPLLLQSDQLVASEADSANQSSSFE